MKYSTAKKYIVGYKKSVAKRNGVFDRNKLAAALKQFNELLDQSKLLGKY